MRQVTRSTKSFGHVENTLFDLAEVCRAEMRNAGKLAKGALKN
jgi:hypothetical protein